MPYKLRKRTRVTKIIPSLSGAASSATLKHTQATSDRPTLRKKTESRRPKRRLRGLSKEESPKVAFKETPSLPKQKRRRIKQSQDIVDTGNLWVSVLESLDVLYQAQENHQRIITTIVGNIETQDRKLMSALRELLDSQKCRVLQDFKDTENRTHSMVVDLVEDLQAQQRHLVEEEIKDTEQRMRLLVNDLVEDMLAQQCHVIALKRSIERYRAGKEDVRVRWTPQF